MICVTHEMGFAKEAADRMVFMERGKLLRAELLNIFLKTQNGSLQKFESNSATLIAR